RLRVWLTRIALGLALLIALKIGHGFYKHYYYSDDIPRVGELIQMLRGSRNWDLHRIKTIVTGESFSRKLMPRVRVAAFVLTLWIVLFWAAAILIYEYLLHFLYHSNRPNRFAPYIWLRRSILSMATLGILCIIYG